jgi:hypothetical protein
MTHLFQGTRSEPTMTANDYNYAVFPPDDDVDAFGDFAHHLKVGETAPDPALTNLDDRQTTRLSTFTDQGLTIVEFGSLT